MTDKTPESFSPPQVQDKRIVPPGVLPRNVQGWALGGLAAVMIVVIAFFAAIRYGSGSVPTAVRRNSLVWPSKRFGPVSTWVSNVVPQLGHVRIFGSITATMRPDFSAK